VRELGFTPNTMAKRFFTGRTQLVALIMPIEFMFSSSYFKDLFRGVLEALEEEEYDLLLHDSRSKRTTPVQKARELVNGKLVDGLLVVAPMAHDEYPSELSAENIPLVVMGETAQADGVSRVGVPNRERSADAVARLIELGHRNIGMLTYDGGHIEASERLKGYEDALEKAGITTHFTGVGHYERTDAYEETRRMLTEHPEITAIFAANAEMTMGAIDALRALDLRVPDDISLVSFDDCPEFEAMEPSITAVRQDPYRVGLRAAQVLMDLIAGESSASPRLELIDATLVERVSTAAPRKEEKLD
jgi:LacI family transcriptional regulator